MTKTRSRAARTLLVFGLALGAMFGTVAVLGDWQPRLGLDLQGGTRITLQAATVAGGGQVTEDKMSEAVGIIRQRVDGSGVAEAEVTTQGGDQIVVEIPGEQRGDLAARIGDTAQLRFRLVVQGPEPAAPVDGKRPSTPSTSPPPGRSTLQGAELLRWQPSPQLRQTYASYTCPTGGTKDDGLVDSPASGLVTCDASGNKYLLSPAIIEGTQLTDASAGVPQNGVQYVVSLEFDNTASDVFAVVTEAINQTGRQFAIVLDGQVLSAPVVTNGAIRTGQAQISGNFTRESATELANSLKYGALPLSFELQGVDEVGPELAGDQLQAGVVAGIVGLLLVVLYCLLYYRALGLVVVGSLVVAGGAVYAAVLLLGEGLGFTLTLPGVAGLIVAVGITADSFIVFFERLRDEVRDGKSVRAAVEAGWNRARMTILAADTVTLMAALVLYIFAIGAVKGFAFALGLTTLIDIFVVFFFTKPLVAQLGATRFFGQGHRLSGLDPTHLGVAQLPGMAARSSRRTSGGVA
ncbi:MAG: protein translocase subunit SecD [Nocardioidaceae bacterium]